MAKSLTVIGAGYLGTAIAQHAVHLGWSPVVIARRTPQDVAGMRSIGLDVQRPESLRQLPLSSALVYAVSADRHDHQAYARSYHTGLAHVLEVAHSWETIPLIALISSTSVYREDGGNWLSEDQAPLVEQGPSHAIVRGEDALRASGLPYIILRFGGIYGPGRRYFVGRVERGEERLYQGPPIYTNRIHRDDGARLVMHLLGNAAHHNQTYNAVDCDPADRNDVCLWLHQQLGVAEAMPSTADRREIPARGNKRCHNAKLLATGFTFDYPSFREGYAAMLAAE